MPNDDAQLLAADVVELEHLTAEIQHDNDILRAMLSETLELTHRLIVSLYARFIDRA